MCKGLLRCTDNCFARSSSFLLIVVSFICLEAVAVLSNCSVKPQRDEGGGLVLLRCQTALIRCTILLPVSSPWACDAMILQPCWPPPALNPCIHHPSVGSIVANVAAPLPRCRCFVHNDRYKAPRPPPNATLGASRRLRLVLSERNRPTDSRLFSCLKALCGCKRLR